MIKSSFNFIHTPVLLNESINFLTNKKNTIFIDGTFGDGGHTKDLLEKNKTCKVYAIDRDPNVKENVKFFQKKYNKRFKFIPGRISDLEKIVSHENSLDLDFDPLLSEDKKEFPLEEQEDEHNTNKGNENIYT